MRDDDDSAAVPVERPLEELEPREVEVVGRLVEQEHVGVDAEDRLERGARLLAPGAVRDLGLLRDVRDGQARWLAADRALVRLLEPGEHTKERRLPDPVRPDDPDPALGRHDQRHAVEDHGVAERLADRTGGENAAGARHADHLLGLRDEGSVSVSVRA